MNDALNGPGPFSLQSYFQLDFVVSSRVVFLSASLTVNVLHFSNLHAVFCDFFVFRFSKTNTLTGSFRLWNNNSIIYEKLKIIKRETPSNQLLGTNKNEYITFVFLFSYLIYIIFITCMHDMTNTDRRPQRNYLSSYMVL